MRTMRKGLGEWLLPRVRREVLGLLLTGTEQRWHLREIARRTGCALGAVRREVEGLAAAGIVTRTRDGNRVYYQANTTCPIHAELRGLMLKTVGLADVLREALAPIAGRIAVAFVYGSIAGGDAGPESDVDVMVVGNVTFADVALALGPTQEKLRREVNPAVYPRPEFRRKVKTGHHFVLSVLRGPKVFLVGGEDELAGLGAGRLAQEA